MRKPKYRRHTSRNLGFVEFNGKRHYLPGPYKSPESLDAYRKFLRANIPELTPLPSPSEKVLVAHVILAFEKWAEANYPPGGRSEYANCHAAFGHLSDADLACPATDFGPLRLKALMHRMAKAGAVRTYVNATAARIKRAFKWAASEEMIPSTAYHSLATVQGIRVGRTMAREPKPKIPVEWEHVAPVLLELSPTVAAMVRVQWFTGVRSQSVCQARAGQFDCSSTPWVWRSKHKTEATHDVAIFVGPGARAVLEPFLAGRKPADYLFQPRHLNGKAARGYRAFYDSVSYLRAVSRAIDRVNRARAEDKLEPIPRWTPHQLRHARATSVRQAHGLEAAQAALGHASLQATQIYAQKQLELARMVAEQMG